MYTHCCKNQQTHAHACALLPNITSPIGGYSTLATQPYLCKACYPTKHTYVLVQWNDEYAGACRRTKTRGRQNLALPDACRIQEVALRDQASCSITWERGYTGEREMRYKHMRLQYFPVLHRSLTSMTGGWKNEAGAPSVRFLVDFSVQKFQSFVSLNRSKRNVFV